MKKTLTFGVFPFLPASRLEAVFAPLAAEISGALQSEVLYQSSSSFEKFADRLANEEFDIAFIQPFDYLKIASQHNYFPLVRRNESLRGVYVVRQDSPLNSIKDLKGKTIAMAPETAALSYLGKISLVENGLIPARDVVVQHFRSHHSCLQEVLIGHADACVTGEPAMRMFTNLNKVQLRILGQTEASAAMLFVAHARVPAERRELIRRVLRQTNLEYLEPGLRTLLKKADQPAFVRAEDRDFDELRALMPQISDLN